MTRDRILFAEVAGMGQLRELRVNDLISFTQTHTPCTKNVIQYVTSFENHITRYMASISADKLFSQHPSQSQLLDMLLGQKAKKENSRRPADLYATTTTPDAYNF